MRNILWCVVGFFVFLYVWVKNQQTRYPRKWLTIAFLLVLAAYFMFKTEPVVQAAADEPTIKIAETKVVQSVPIFRDCKLFVNNRDLGILPCKQKMTDGVHYVVFFSKERDHIEAILVNKGKGFRVMYLSPEYQQMLTSIAA